MNDTLNEQIDPWNDPTASTKIASASLERKIQRLIAEDAAQQLRTEQYYKKLKAENLDNFLSPKVQKAMEADAQALGEKWFDGDE